jgi:hypothetical protein
VAGRGHDQREGVHGDLWSSLRAPARRFRRGAADGEDALATLPPAPERALGEDDADDDVAELRAVRSRLARELEIMDERVGRLARVKEARERAASTPADAAQLAAVHAKLRRAAEALEDAHRVRDAVAGHLVAREHDAIVEGAPAAARRRRRLAPLVAVSLIGALGLGALGATLLDRGDSPTPTPAPVPSPPRAAAAPEPRCSELPPAAGGSCVTGTSLTIAPRGRPLVMRDVEARVSGVARNGDSVDIRLRLRNETGASQDLSGRIYLSIRGQRLYAQAGSIPARGMRTLALSFPVGDAAGKADLGIVPFGEPADGPRRRLGVLRLAVPAP